MIEVSFRTRLILLTWLAGFSCQLGLAQEQILSFHSDIDIAVDASMIVTETIRVRAEGTNIQRGIFRDFPTRYSDRLGNNYVVGFELLSLSRDRVPEASRIDDLSNGVRIYAGSANVILDPGEYTYTISYRTDRQIGYFEDHDELYWNVTGHEWGFVIEQASASVRLPGSVSVSAITIRGYTGLEGGAGQAYSASVAASGGSIATTAALASQEGLTLVIGWPKGIVTEPTSTQRITYLLQDNLGLMLALIALFGSIVYLYNSWLRVGKDPDSGNIFPRYNPPAGYSPASARYISRMGYDSKTFTAAVVNLAVKGYLKIQKNDDKYSLEKTKSSEPLAPGEKILLEALFSDGAVLDFGEKCFYVLQKARQKHKKALQRDYLNIYFATNLKWLMPSLIGSIVMLGLILFLQAFVPLVAACFMLIVILHVWFAYLMKAPLQKGRLLMNQLEGFKLYLETIKKDDLNLGQSPDKAPELFERFLPFAIALGVENAWSEQFTTAFERLERSDGHSYQPLWYTGAFHHSQLHGFSEDIGSGFNSAISSAAATPGSTTGAGGTVGGGGGGGGGW